MKTRIAPTPSGYLHAGNAFNFLVTARLAEATGSELVLRIDDLDRERVRPEYIEDIFVSLSWLGIRFDEGPSGPTEFAAMWSQQLRLVRYTKWLEMLRAKGAIYPCACSRSRIEEQQRTGADHGCRHASIIEPLSNTAWRLRIPEQAVVTIRQLNGTSELIDLASAMSDPVIQQRENGRPAYQIASLADDVDMGMTMIVRGTDLLPSTACQVYLAAILGCSAFKRIGFHHHPLTMDAKGEKLSKSASSSSLKAMREAGVSAEALIGNANAYADKLLAVITV